MGTVTECVRESECPGCSGMSITPISGQEFLSLCSDCGLVFDNPRPSEEAIAAHYNQESQYDGWLEQLDDRARLWARRIRKMRRHRKPGSLLDVGAGIGQFLSQARTEYSPVLGTEISSTAIELAGRLYGVDVLNGDIEGLQISQQFDNVTAFHVLEHVHWPSEFLRCCHKLLSPGGRLFLAVPNDLEALPSRIGRCSLTSISLSASEIHLSHFTTRSLATLLRRSGFEVIHLSLDPYWVVPSSKERLQTACYVAVGVVHYLTDINLYPTTWAVAQKSDQTTATI
jgi:2-polyprenyl-3-methyl-5-hydroxy-6-metoxy-1,4-benzoquinol methylase